MWPTPAGFVRDYPGLDWCPVRVYITILRIEVVKFHATRRAKFYRT
jgi:hypothetical protein